MPRGIITAQVLVRYLLIVTALIRPLLIITHHMMFTLIVEFQIRSLLILIETDISVFIFPTKVSYKVTA